MRVLHVEAGMHLYGGARQVYYLLQGLHVRGIENLLACPAGSAIGQVAAPYVQALQPMAMGGDVDLGLVVRLRRLIDQTRPDIVHLHSRRGADTLGGLAARLARPVPRVVLSRRVDNPEPRRWVGIKYRLYDKVITISEGIRQVLLEEGLAPEKVVCVPSAVDDHAFEAGCDREWYHKEFEIEPGSCVIGVIAQLIERKGHRYLIEALPHVIERYPDVRVLIFGKGPLEAAIRRQIAAAGLEGRVRLVGFRTDLARVLPCLRMVVHPALMEGLGIALLEAAAAGLPIIASRAGGMPEIVRDGENGLLIPPGDVPALAKALEALLGAPQRAQRMGKRGREIVAERFSVDAMVEGNLAVYRSLLDG
jgi:glycosyltransferase involved in cell wall biosynthesis